MTIGFAALEERAAEFRRDAELGKRVGSDKLIAGLKSHADVDVKLVSQSDASSVIRRWDSAARVLTISEQMLEQRLKFQLAHYSGFGAL